MTPSDDELGAIHSLSWGSVASLDVDDLLGEILKKVAEILHVDTAAVLLADEKNGQLIARAAIGIEGEVSQGVRVRMGRGFAGRIAAEKRPVLLERIDNTTVENPLLWERGIKRMLGVPLKGGDDQVLGVLHVGHVDDRQFVPNAAELLELVADRVGSAIESRELEAERAAARLLQRSLLPTAPPEIPGFEFAMRYVPAQRGGVGGDWYDVFHMPTGEIWLTVGDVAGHGLESAVIMGRLRAALRSYALIGDEPEEVIARTSRKLEFFEPGKFATALCCKLVPPYESIKIVSAGHPPPLVAVGPGAFEILEIPVGPPLGISGAKWTSSDEDFPLGALFLAYTDGLVERRGEVITDSIQRIVTATTAMEPEIVCREVMDALIGRDIPQDDVAVLAMRRSLG